MDDIVKTCKKHGELASRNIYQHKKRHGIYLECKLCRNEASKKHRQANIEKFQEIQRAWRSKNKEKIRGYKRAWRIKNAV